MNSYFMNVHKYKEDYSNVSLINFDNMEIEHIQNDAGDTVAIVETPIVVKKDSNYFVIFLEFDGKELTRSDKHIDLDPNFKMEKLSRILNENIINESMITKILSSLAKSVFETKHIPSANFKLEVLTNSLESMDILEHQINKLEKELQDLKLEMNSKKLAYKSIQKEFLYPLHFDD